MVLKRYSRGREVHPIVRSGDKGGGTIRLRGKKV